MRFDLTVPLARFVAQHERELAFPFRRYHIAKVYRGESAQRGRYREFYQCDIDIIGREKLSIKADAEMPAVISTLFRLLDVGSFTIKISNRKLLQGYLESLGLASSELRGEVIRTIDKLDKIGIDGVMKTLSAIEALDANALEPLRDFLAIDGSAEEVIEGLKALGCKSSAFQLGLSELEELVEELDACSVPREDWAIDCSIARGLDYYTGTVYETFLDEHPDIGSVCSGGRYENLAGLYTRAKLPGVGISIGATRLFFKLQEAQLLGQVRSTVDVLVTQLDEALRGHLQKLTGRLREAGYRCCLWSEGTKMKKQMTWADKMAVPLVVIVGEDERARGQVRLKHLGTGEQWDVDERELVELVGEKLAL
jgi:histidyl-tRNA synthetase